MLSLRHRGAAALGSAAWLASEALTRGTLAGSFPDSGSGGELGAAAAPDGAGAAGAAAAAVTAAAAGLGAGGADADASTLLAAVLACCYVLFVCGACPLWVAYHLERVYKQRWLQSHPGLAWVNPPPPGKAGAWPSAAAAARQLGVLLAVSLVASEACVSMWAWLGLPVWSNGA
jgi:hypothetical protein